MAEYAQALGDTVKRARLELGLTQEMVAEKSNVDVRTVINIEKNRGNPKLEKLFPIIRTLQIDPREIFYPEGQRESTAIRRLRILAESCTEEEAAAMIPVIESVLSVARSKEALLLG